MEACPACGAPTGRRQFSDYWRCDNGHTIYRQEEVKPLRYVVRHLNPIERDPWHEGEWAVIDLSTDEPYFRRADDWYAYGIPEHQARSLCHRLTEG